MAARAQIVYRTANDATSLYLCLGCPVNGNEGNFELVDDGILLFLKILRFTAFQRRPLQRFNVERTKYANEFRGIVVMKRSGALLSTESDRSRKVPVDF